jgi:hypothetical protein
MYSFKTFPMKMVQSSSGQYNKVENVFGTNQECIEPMKDMREHVTMYYGNTNTEIQTWWTISK